MMYRDSGGGWIFDWNWILMATTMIAFFGFLVVAGVVLYRHSIRTGTVVVAPIPADEPSRILAERYAQGEIDETEYLDRLTRLRAYDQD